MLKCRAFCQKCVVFQDRWSLMAAVSQDRFHCTSVSVGICPQMPNNKRLCVPLHQILSPQVGFRFYRALTLHCALYKRFVTREAINKIDNMWMRRLMGKLSVLMGKLTVPSYLKDKFNLQVISKCYTQNTLCTVNSLIFARDLFGKICDHL